MPKCRMPEFNAEFRMPNSGIVISVRNTPSPGGGMGAVKDIVYLNIWRCGGEDRPGGRSLRSAVLYERTRCSPLQILSGDVSPSASLLFIM